MIKLLIIADDFTGAVDTGVQFSKKEIPVIVTTDRKISFDTVPDEAEVLVIDIESRHVAPQEAYERVLQIARAAFQAGVSYFYKKTDSTLRGNIGAELTALLDASEISNQLAFIPAFPKRRRTTLNGIQYVDNIELEKTEFSHDLFEPVRQSSVAEIIRHQSGVSTKSIPSNRYNEAENDYQDKTICIYDVQTDDDIKKLGLELKSADRLNVLAGCAGFAETLPELLELRKAVMYWEKNSSNVLIISGSVNQIAIDQINYAKENGYISITLSPYQKLSSDFLQSEACAEMIKEIATDLLTCNKVIIESVSTRDQILDVEKYAYEYGIPYASIHQLIIKNIGELVKRILDMTVVGNLVVFGGDTLYGIMERLNCDKIFPVLEIAPGIVAAKAQTQTCDLRIISKAGGFGSKNVVEVINDFVFH